MLQVPPSSLLFPPIGEMNREVYAFELYFESQFAYHVENCKKGKKNVPKASPSEAKKDICINSQKVALSTEFFNSREQFGIPSRLNSSCSNQ